MTLKVCKDRGISCHYKCVEESITQKSVHYQRASQRARANSAAFFFLFFFFVSFFFLLRGAKVKRSEQLFYGAESQRYVIRSNSGLTFRQHKNYLCQPSHKWVPSSNKVRIR